MWGAARAAWTPPLVEVGDNDSVPQKKFDMEPSTSRHKAMG